MMTCPPLPVINVITEAWAAWGLLKAAGSHLAGEITLGHPQFDWTRRGAL